MEIPKAMWQRLNVPPHYSTERNIFDTTFI
ncbi:hypothetical protein COLO4_11420 [Corchorus olitorius]|uniref:Uncharacterized protein n=1 Tax=Corchorus olitorius TaxID=93759 RepID=A0A1R3K4I4_9ROSI|nr:hypothetical protein COLO4_11420 [Corchorus olitorius]